MMRIFLVGMMGSGKTTIGRMLSDVLGIPFVDMDEVIEKREGKQIEKIFVENGEEYFRKNENRLLNELLLEKNVVVASGGGIVLNKQNRKLLEEEKTVFLKVEPEELMNRVNVENRPLLQGKKERVLKLWNERRRFYEEFPCVNTTSLTPWESVVRVLYEVLEHQEIEVKAYIHPVSLELCGFKKISEYEHVFTTKRLAKLYGDFFKFEPLELPDGESAKEFEHVFRCYKHLTDIGFSREDTLVGVGGGALTDVAGFVSSTFKRGTGLTLFPTTLLAQVDAAIGGKNGVDFAGVKNLIGTIRMPDLTVIDPVVTLSMDPERFEEGIVEAFKMALISGRGYDEFKNRVGKLKNREIRSLIKFIKISIEEKSKIVSGDPSDKGQRKCLNLGHTLGHLFEAITKVPHGIAVAWGMEKEMYFFRRHGMIDERMYEDVMETLGKIIDIKIPEIPRKKAEEFLKNDKKGHPMRIGKIDIPFVKVPGSFEIIQVDPEELLEVM